jgi:hypothetical protein
MLGILLGIKIYDDGFLILVDENELKKKYHKLMTEGHIRIFLLL